ncbi:hypothetical protein THICB1_100192 [Thiomonas arsenitoxydans]|uniref:Uncharacterized protein n=1 Tax=Thiomonas arsenitoxydans (strain DSM 22701 / CIP 110005 / 3As) TaxID=426114 RepID=A0ABM9T092_THIA3|nr:hypothetical protein THICB1_100192 [Thiomonas arsenitoxydans]
MPPRRQLPRPVRRTRVPRQTPSQTPPRTELTAAVILRGGRALIDTTQELENLPCFDATSWLYPCPPR